MLKTFIPRNSIVGSVQPTYKIEELEAEPMLFSSSISFAIENGGPITRSILNQLASFKCPSYLYPVIDTRVHMLMPGQYPAMPGWHGDAYPRIDYNSQPDVFKEDPNVLSFVCVIDDGTNCSLTKFLTKPVTVKINPFRVWKSVHDTVENSLSLSEALGTLDTDIFMAQAGTIYQMAQSQLHTPTPAICRGWRMFFRMTFYQHPPKSKIRNQTQVYVIESGGGW